MRNASIEERTKYLDMNDKSENSAEGMASSGAVRQCWAGLRDEIETHYAALWNTPELPNMEYRSSALLCDWLESHGFVVERKACGIETAFVARKGSGRPVVALLAEFDALPGLGNAPSGARAPTGQPAGHACGHNHIGPTNTARQLRPPRRWSGWVLRARSA